MVWACFLRLCRHKTKKERERFKFKVVNTLPAGGCVRAVWTPPLAVPSVPVMSKLRGRGLVDVNSGS